MGRMHSQKFAVFSLPSATAAEDTLSDVEPLTEPVVGGLTHVIEQMPALLWTTDVELEITHVYGNGLGRLQRSPSHLVGMPVESIFESDDHDFPALAAHKGALGGHARSFEFTLGGSTFWGNVEPLFNADWNLVGTIGIAVDITERKLAEEQRRRDETHRRDCDKRQSLMRLAGGMAHHFNNMLTAMMGYASVARNELPADHPARRHIDEIEKIAIDAADLSHQLQTFGQRHQPHTETVELSELIETSKPMLQAILPPSITLRTELLDGLPSLNADPEQLRRLLVQLLYQASESIGADAGTVVLRTQLFSGQPGLAFNQADCAELPAGEYVWLQVSDTGPGLDDEAKEQLFEPFPSGAEGSRGPGLATALGIVHGHRGAIVVSSKVGLGTTWHILLPAAPSSVEAPESYF